MRNLNIFKILLLLLVGPTLFPFLVEIFALYELIGMLGLMTIFFYPIYALLNIKLDYIKRQAASAYKKGYLFIPTLGTLKQNPGLFCCALPVKGITAYSIWGCLFWVASSSTIMYS